MSRVNRRDFLKSIGAGAACTSFGACSAIPRRGITEDLPVDDYWPEPRSDFETRRRMFLEYSSARPQADRKGVFTQISRLALGREPVDEDIVRDGIEFVYSNRDCNDFTVSGILRILYLYRESPLISRELIAEMEECVLKFKYWWDGPGTDDRCYHTENHQITFHMDELLAGQLFPDRVFKNSCRTGRYHIARATHLIGRWMDFRQKFGFSEWLSNGYFDTDLMALANLYDFAESPDIRLQAEMMMDIILFEIALHSYHGVFGSTHGRTYTSMIKGGRGEPSQSITKLMFGMGTFNRPDSVGTVSLATGSYRCPKIIQEIAADFDRTVLSKERHSLDIEDAPKYGLSYEKVEDGHLYWSIQDYVHPNIIDLSRRMSETFGVRKFEDYDAYADQYAEQIEEHGKIVNPDLCHKALTEVHIQTYRAKDYMLSCAQDYRPGRGGYQQHIWQATLGIDAVVFTNHPGSLEEEGRPNFWASNGVLPRAAQHRNFLVCIHKVPPENERPFSHAYFPRSAFDEIVERNHWIFARKDDGYIALYSQHAPVWIKNRNGEVEEVRADSPTNIWLCELGSRSDSGGFSSFVSAVTSAGLSCADLNVLYESPSVGRVEFGWEGDLRVAGQHVPLHNYPRFDNPYCKSEFMSPSVVIRRGNAKLLLDFETGTRSL